MKDTLYILDMIQTCFFKDVFPAVGPLIDFDLRQIPQHAIFNLDH